MCSSAVTNPLANLCVQVESALAVQKLKPTIDAIKRQYGDDKNSIQRETSALYEASGVNPAAGELRTLMSSTPYNCQRASLLDGRQPIWKTAPLEDPKCFIFHEILEK